MSEVLFIYARDKQTHSHAVIFICLLSVMENINCHSEHVPLIVLTRLIFFILYPRYYNSSMTTLFLSEHAVLKCFCHCFYEAKR